MYMTALASETFMDYEFVYKTDDELSTLLLELDGMKRNGLCKDIQVVPCTIRDTYKGAVYACLRCDAVDSLYYKLCDCGKEVIKDVHTIYDDYIEIA